MTAYKLLDGVQQFATGTGTGPLTLAGPTSPSFRTLSGGGLAVGDSTRLRIEHATDLGQWEVVRVTLNGNGTISRTLDQLSLSATGALIDFAAGDKVVSSVVVASDIGALVDTTPVAPAGSTLKRVIPDWLAGAPIIECSDDVLVEPDHRGCWLHMINPIGSLVKLPDDWLPGMAFGVRQMGTGTVVWQYVGGSTVQLPFSKLSHTGIAEQYEEVIFRVLTNTTGHNAVWGVSGGTY